jgi:hypothetical protein
MIVCLMLNNFFKTKEDSSRNDFSLFYIIIIIIIIRTMQFKALVCHHLSRHLLSSRRC